MGRKRERRSDRMKERKGAKERYRKLNKELREKKRKRYEKGERLWLSLNVFCQKKKLFKHFFFGKCD